MADIPSVQDFENGKRDLDDIAKLANTNDTINTRFGTNPKKTYSKIMEDLTQQFEDNYVTLNPRGYWVTGTLYNKNDLWQINSDNTWVRVLKTYTSGASEDIDLGSGNVEIWQGGLTRSEGVSKISSVFDMTAFANLQEGDNVNLIGYHPDTTVGGGSGFGKLARHNGGTCISKTRTRPSVWGDDSEMTAWFADSGTDEICLVRPDSKEVMLSDFGARDNESVDKPLTACINYSKANGFKSVISDVDNWTLSEQMPQLNTDFNSVKITGKGRNGMSRGVCDTVTGPHFLYRGGSGGHIGEVMENMDITKTVSGPLIENTGLCGASFSNCRISAQVIVGLSNDIGSGTFTEFNILHNCALWCESVYTMTRGSGNDSFHGCGVDGTCVINQRENSQAPLFAVGSVDDGVNRIVWYNAPLNCQIFTKTENQPLIGARNTGANVITTKGSPTFELFSNKFTVSTFPHHHAGEILCSGKGLLMGETLRVGSTEIGVSGKTLGIVQPQMLSFVKPGDGTTDVNVGRQMAGRLSEFSCRYTIWTSAPNYEACFTVETVGRYSASLAPNAVVRNVMTLFNSAGYGTPSASMIDNELIISAPWGDANVTFKIVRESC